MKEIAMATPGFFAILKRRLAILLLIGIALIGVAHCFISRYMKPIGSGPAGPSVAAELFEHVWTERPVVLLGLGDSVTDGFGASPGHDYFSLLVEPPADEFPDMAGRNLRRVLPKLTVVNHAMSGSTSFQVGRQQLARLDSFSAETLGLVVMTTGGNDLIHNYGITPPNETAMYGATWEQAQPWIAGFAARLEGIEESLTGLFPGGHHLFIATIYDPSDGVGDIEHAALTLPVWPDGRRVLTAYNAVIVAFAARHPPVHLVDVHAVMLGHGIHCDDRANPHYQREDPHYWYYWNLEDPNDRGYDAIRRVFLLELARVCANGGGK
jgi:lysophospholipase L1-like esterase